MCKLPGVDIASVLDDFFVLILIIKYNFSGGKTEIRSSLLKCFSFVYKSQFSLTVDFAVKILRNKQLLTPSIDNAKNHLFYLPKIKSRRKEKQNNQRNNLKEMLFFVWIFSYRRPRIT